MSYKLLSQNGRRLCCLVTSFQETKIHICSKDLPFNFHWVLRSSLEGTGAGPSHYAQAASVIYPCISIWGRQLSDGWAMANYWMNSAIATSALWIQFRQCVVIWVCERWALLGLPTNCLSAELITCGTVNALQIKSQHSISIWDLMKNSIPFCQCTQLPTVFNISQINLFLFLEQICFKYFSDLPSDKKTFFLWFSVE